ncbi:contractile injection system tape measure protein [Aquiflexum sp.]|uniref:contractile injection system tape measure protein n=1 Tax=Aquiflexum sp. TaxID=1872584 RepID=UPI0035935B9A
MSGLQNHKIHTASLQVDFEGMEDGLGMHESLSLFFHEKIEPALQKIFDERSAYDLTFKIEKLELDCGFLDNSDWEKKLLDRIIEQVETILKAKQHKTEDLMSTVKSAEDVFIFFVAKGYFPWNSPFRNVLDLEEELEINESLIKRLVNLSNKSGNIIPRISGSFSKFFPEKLVEFIVRNETGWIKKYVIQGLKLPNRTHYFLKEYLTILFQSMKNEIGLEPVLLWTNIINNKPLFQTPGFFEFFVDKIIKNEEIRENFQLAVFTSTEIQPEGIKQVKKLMDKIIFIDPQLKGNSWFRKINLFLEDRNLSQSTEIENTTKVQNSSISSVSESSSFEQTHTSIPERSDPKYPDNFIFIENAGMVLLHPFLLPFFENINLTRENKFLSQKWKNQAIQVLEYCTWGENGHKENYLPLNKILCGMNPEAVWERESEVTDNSKMECEELLKEVIKHWAALKNTGINGLRETFLQRPGRLSHGQNGWKLTVEQKAVDVLLGSLPWGIGIIKLPWMPEMLFVEWN